MTNRRRGGNIKMKKLLITLLSVLLLLSGCSIGKKAGSGKWDISEPKTIDEEATAAFEQYQYDELVAALASNKLNAHFIRSDLETFGLDDMNATLGDISEDYDYSGVHESYEALKAINRDGLSAQNKNYYDRYMMALEQTLDFEGLDDYGFAFSSNGLNANLLTTFTEFVIREEQDIKDMIVYLNESEDYLKEYVDYTKVQADKGFEQAASTMQNVIDQVERFLSSKGNNEVSKAINDQIDAADYLTDAQKEDYKAQIIAASDGPLMNGYQYIYDYFTARINETTSTGQFTDANAKKYFEALYRDKSSSFLTPKEIKQVLLGAVEKDIAELRSIYMINPSIYDQIEPTITDPEEMLSNNIAHMPEDFPTPDPEIEYSVNYLDPSVASDSIAAYYINPPIDIIKKGNVIKVNPATTSGLYSTISHEGYPGHCYQITYDYINHPTHFHELMNFLGYTEGWAMYVEEYGLKYAFDGDEATAKFAAIDETLFYQIMAIVDIMVNYEGASVDDVADFISDYFGGEHAQTFFDIAIDDPGAYIPYGFGLAMFKNMRAEAREALGDKFNPIEYHQVILDAGACNFEYLQLYVDQYIKDNK